MMMTAAGTVSAPAVIDDAVIAFSADLGYAVVQRADDRALMRPCSCSSAST